MNRILFLSIFLLGGAFSLFSQTEIFFKKSTSRVSENAGQFSVWVHRSGTIAAPALVKVRALAASTALAGQDFNLNTQQLVFAPGGPDSLAIPLAILDDTDPSNACYLLLELYEPNGAILGGTRIHSVLIADDDTPAPLPATTSGIHLEWLSSTRLDTVSDVSAQFSAYDPGSKRLFVNNRSQNRIEVLDISHPEAPQKVKSLMLSAYGGNINHIAAQNGIVAAAVEAIPATSPGKVVFFDADLNYLAQAPVGAMPIMLVFAPNGKVVVANSGEPDLNYNVDPVGSVSIVGTDGSSVTLGFEAYNSQAQILREIGVRIFGPGATVAQDLEPEYVAISDDGQFAYVSLQENNALAVIDLTSQSLLELRSFGTKDWSAGARTFDASDQAPGVFFNAWPVKSLYQPDGINFFRHNGIPLLIAACEGEDRVYNTYSESRRLGSPDFPLDPQRFPDAEWLKRPELLGRLVVSIVDGDTDGDGDFDEIYGFGGRSFAIWNALNGQLVWDSGDALEHITVADPIDGQYFNANYNSNTAQTRSDDKGPEPEDVQVIEFEGRRLAFVSMERVGGMLVYDISDPWHPEWIQYINTRTLDSLGGDRAPEGILFIPAAQSPNNRNLLLLNHEASGTIAIFNLEINRVQSGEFGLKIFDFQIGTSLGMYEGNLVREGGISGVFSREGVYHMLGDRGPTLPAWNNPMANGQAAVVFPMQGYTQKLWSLQRSTGAIGLVGKVQRPDYSNARGVPPGPALGGSGEMPWATASGILIPSDPWGLDAEDIAQDNAGNYWIADEYRTSIWQLDPSLHTLHRYSPLLLEAQDIALDPVFRKRKPGRGFAGLCYLPNGKLMAILESPAYNPDSLSGKQSRIHRILELDPESGQTRVFAYVHEAPTSTIQNEDFRINGLAAINNTEMLVLESAKRGGEDIQHIYKISTVGATPILGDDFSGFTLEQLVGPSGLAAHNLSPVGKTLLADLNELDWDRSLGPPEGIAIVDAQTIALVNDNAYGLYSPANDGHAFPNGIPTRIYEYTLPIDKQLNYVSPYCSIDLGDTLVGCQNAVLHVDIAEQGFVSAAWSHGQVGQIASFTQPAWYSVEAVNNVGCKARDTVYVEFSQNLHVNLGPDRSICPAESLTLSASQAGTVSYQWSNGAQTAQIQVMEAGTYTVTVSEAGACTGTDAVNVSLLPGPTLDLGPDHYFCPGQSVLIGDEPVSGWGYQWSDGGTWAQAYINAPGTYGLTVTNAEGCAATDAVQVLLYPVPLVNLGPDLPLCVNTSIVLDAGNPGSSYQWSSGQNTPTIWALAGSNYAVTVTNGFGCSASDGVSLYAFPQPMVNLGVDQSLCPGDSLLLFVGNAGSIFEWSNGATGPQISGFPGAQYAVTVTNVFACSDSDTILLFESPVPVLDLGADTVICVGEQLLLDAGNPGSAYLWSDGTSGQFFQVDSTQLVTILVWNSFGCMVADSLQVNVEICVAAHEPSKATSLLLYPNPSTGWVEIKVAEATTGSLHVRVMDPRGIQHLEATLLGPEYRLDLGDLPSGIYIIIVANWGSIPCAIIH